MIGPFSSQVDVTANERILAVDPLQGSLLCSIDAAERYRSIG